jgi:hypothetical protein
MYFQRSKWTTAKKQNYGGHSYDSGFESSYAQELDLRVAAGEIKSWERQKTLELRVNGYLICTYRIDFIVYHFDGTTEYVECKGWASPVWRLKWKLFEALYSDLPDVRLTVVKQKDNFILRKLKKS